MAALSKQPGRVQAGVLRPGHVCGDERGKERVLLLRPHAVQRLSTHGRCKVLLAGVVLVHFAHGRAGAIHQELEGTGIRQ